jgi:large repetitive protein
MNLKFTRRLWRNSLIVGILAAIVLWQNPTQAQNSRVYAMSPDGRIAYDRCNDELLVQFESSLTASQVLQLLAKEEAVARLKADEVLPSPKNLVRVRLNKGLPQAELEQLRKRLEQLPQVRYAQPMLVYEDGTRQGISNRIAVKLKNEGDFGLLQSQLNRLGAVLQEKYEYDNLLFFAELPKSAGNPLDVANRLAESGQFAWAEVDFFRFMQRFSTNDPFLANQWSLNNTGSALQFNGTPGADMRVFNAWTVSTGSSNIKVAILDEGVDLVHPDLLGNMLPGFDGTGLNSAGAPSGNDAHGTACAGIVAAVGNNNLGVAGVAYQSKIIPVRIAYSSGANWITQNSWIGTCIDWSWQTAGADVLSNSWGGGGSSALINDPITRAVNQGRGGLGAPVLFAAGNDNGAVSYPATLTNVISVAAMSMCNQRKSPSSCDGENFWGSNFGANLDISAPGVKIYTTDISGSTGYSAGDYTATFNGTSSACPNAAGVMALILSVNPGLNQTQARQIIESTCDKVGGLTYGTNVNQPNGTWTNELGYGRVNAFTAVQLANPQPCTTPAVGTVTASPATVCGSGSVNLSLNGVGFGTGQTYQWQSSTDNVNWTNLSGQTGQTASATVSSASWFRCVVTCATAVASQSTQVTISNPLVTTFPHTQNFDGSSALPCGWSVQNVNGDANTWNLGSTNARSAPNNVVYTYNVTNAANDWLFSAPLQLVAGQNYRVRFWYRARSASFAEQLEVRWGNAANATAMTSAAVFTNTNITNTTYAEGTTVAFVPTVSGTYHVGFRVFSAADRYDLYLDDVTIEITSPCSTPTVAGSITGTTTLTAGTPSSFTYSGGNGTSIIWQQAIGTTAAFTDIAGATSSTLSYTNVPGTYRLRMRVSRTNCVEEFSNVLTLTINPRVGDNLNLPIVVNLPLIFDGSTTAGSGFSNAYTGANNQASPDVFYRFTTGPCADSIQVSTCGSGFDTYLHLLNATGTNLSSNDDNGPFCTGTNASLRAVVLPNTTYFVVVEGYAALTGFFTLNVNEIDNPIAANTLDTSGPLSFCEGGSVTLTASAGSSYAWSNGATTQSITATATGNYSVSITDANGCSSSASVEVSVLTPQAASISASGPLSFCQGGSVTLTASAGSSYAWSNGATTQSITATASGNYSVSVTDANGCSSSASVEVSVLTPQAASISASGPLSFCEGGSVTLTASAGSSYAWSNGATTQSITATATGNYSVTVTNGCSSSTSVEVSVLTPQAASISASGPLSFCQGGSVVLTASAGSSYAWSNGATTQSITATATGNYSVSVTDANGCSSSASVEVSVLTPQAASISASGPLSFCEGGSVTLTASAGSSYAWSNGATTQSITATATGNYSVTVTNGCSSSTSVEVSVLTPQAASISASGPLSFCQGGSVVLTASAGSSYAWSNGATTQSITATATGNYSVSVTDANGCSSSASVEVSVLTPQAASISASGPLSFCQGGSVTLTASAGSSYVWSNGATKQSITATATGNYSVSVTDANGCSSSAAVEVNVFTPQAASISASGPLSFCQGGSVTLTASAGSSYAWSNGATTQSITASATGNYSVTVTDVNGCSSQAQAVVNVWSAPIVNAGTYSTTTTLSGALTLAGSPAGGSFSGNFVNSNSFDPRPVAQAVSLLPTTTLTPMDVLRATMRALR